MRLSRIVDATMLGLLLGTVLAGCGGSPAATPVPSVTPIQVTATDLPSPAAAATRTPLPSLTPSQTAKAVNVAATVATQNAPGPVSSPASPAAQQPSATSALFAASPQTSVTPLPTQAAVLPGGPPPFDITIPKDWEVAYAVVPTRELFAQQTMNMAVYRGPVNGGRATVIALWGFPSLGPPPTLAGPNALTAVPGTPSSDLQNQILWADGLRLLQGTVVGVTCNVAHYGQRPLTVGGRPAIGESFNSAQCQGEPDTYGWFAGLNENGSNFLFYTFIEPVEAYNGARLQMQQILDTVKFHTGGQTPAASGTQVGPPPTNTSAGSQPTTTPILQ